MIRKTVTSLAFAAGCVLAFGAIPTAQAQYANPELVTNGPQASRGDFGSSAQRNNIESAQYDRLLQTNGAFRAARMSKECGPIGDPQLHAQCVARFSQNEPAMYGSSIPPGRGY